MLLQVAIKKKLSGFVLDMEFEAAEGVLALLGSSGCGKSMTLKCIAGIEKPDEGRITLDGRVLFDSTARVNLPPQKRRIGYMFQDYALFPNMTVRENVKTGMTGNALRRARSKREKEELEDAVSAILKRFQIEDLALQYPDTLSGGQKQRVALARLIAQDPEVILLDEPFSALDSDLRWQLVAEMKETIKTLQKPVVFVTHSRNEVLQLSDRICRITSGKSGPTVFVDNFIETTSRARRDEEMGVKFKTHMQGKETPMKQVRTEDAVGHVLCHDMTQIIRGVTKDAIFRKGHIVTEEDIPVLLSIGKEHLYVWEKDDTMLHEDEGAEILRRLCQSEHMRATEPKEGKISLQAECAGVLKIKREKLLAVNSCGDVMIATKRGDTLIRKEQVFAGMRVIPLVISKMKMAQVEAAAGAAPLLTLLPLKVKRAAILATGSEIFKGRIQDTFTPVIEEKLTELGCTIMDKRILDDDPDAVTAAILARIGEGAELVCVTGGMSVDPDDKTPLAIKMTGAQIISYGAPVLPGAMFLLSYYWKPDGTAVPIVGLPGCVMYAKRTIFDLVLPRLLADDPVTSAELAALGEGGLL